MLAITHIPSAEMERGQRTFVGRFPIDHALATRQHANYCGLLKSCGATIRILDGNLHLPDCAFVEDTAVVLDEVAVLCSMGSQPRRAEPAGIEQELLSYREVIRVEPPATLEGGDVVRIDKTLLVGQSSRTNLAGIQVLSEIAGRFGYRIVPIKVRQCLHLKTACCALPDGRLLVNANWIDRLADELLEQFEMVNVRDEEPWGANILTLNNQVVIEAAQQRTAKMIRKLGFEVHTIDLSEFTKAEAGVTCLSLILDPRRRNR